MNAIISLLQFCTILPLGKAAEFDAFARRTYLYPIAGYVIGGIAAVITFFITDTPLAAGIAMAAVLILSGFNHFDGLLDLGDGLMAHGSREKRVGALKDRQVGAGGVGTGIIVTLLSFSGLLGVTSIPGVILIAEVSAKASMAWLTVYGTPFNEGMHSYLHSATKPWFPFATLLLFTPLILLPGSPWQVVTALGSAVVLVMILLFVSFRLFGGVNGDIVGASNEIVRMAVILVLAVIW